MRNQANKFNESRRRFCATESWHKKRASSNLGRGIWLARFIPALIFAFLLPFITDAFTISPTIREYEIERGGNVRGSVTIRNDRATSVDVEVVTKNFTARDEHGAPQFNETTDNLAEWIQVPEKKFMLTRGASRRVDYTISIPQYALSGGYSTGILFIEKAHAQFGSGATLGNRLASLVLVRVPGDTLEKGRVTEFFVEKREKNPTRVQFAIRFENLGNVFLKPYGKITIRNWFGRKASEIFVNDSGGNVLPESGRKFLAEWSDVDEKGGARGFRFGRYTAEAEIFYGSKNIREIARTGLWLVSRQGLIAFGGMMVLGVLLVWKLIKRIRGRRFFVERI